MDEKIIKQFFKQKGLTDAGVAGLIGNLYAESGLNPQNLQNTYNKKLKLSDAEYTANVDNGKYKNFIKDNAGYGLAQWTFWTRKQNLLNYAKNKKTSIGDLQTQLEFLYQELSNNFKPVLEILTKTSSVWEASNTVLFKFEQPADTSNSVQNLRYQYSLSYYSKGVDNKIMKYNDNNKPIVCMQTQSNCYKATREMKVLGVLWHSTGANNPSIKRYVQPSDNAPDREKMLKLLGKNQYNNDWNHINRQAGMNCWIGKLADESITTVQTMPWNWRPWGCGSGPKGSCNDGWIQFEICEDNLKNKEYFEAVYEEACQITAYLCKMFNIDPLGTVQYKGITIPTIICHKDSYTFGCGNNHADIYHWFPKYGKSMETARQDVANILKSNNAQISKPIESKNETNSLQIGQTIKLKDGAVYTTGKAIPNWVMKKDLYVRKINGNNITISILKSGAITGVVNINQIKLDKMSPYRVQVSKILNVRSEPNDKAKIVAQIQNKGVFTIVEENNGWGKLKSGIGWIYLNYTKKI